MRCLVGLVSAVLLCLLVPTAAVAETDGWATMVSTRGDGIGQGTHRTFDTAAGDAVTAGTDDGDLQVWVSGGPGGEGFEMEFAAPAGQALAPGVYLGAQRSVFRAEGRPGIDIGGEGRGCSLVRGGFELRELAVAADGSVTRLWLLYEQRCELGPELFGEVRIGAPPTGGLRTVPSVARFPGVDAGKGGHTIQVTVPDASLADVQLVGDGASQFIVRDRQCADVGCEVWVRYMPDAAGTHRAWLRLTDTMGRRADVPLQGFAYGGTNRLTIVSDPGDPVGHGRSYDYGPEAWFGADQSYSTISAGVFDGDLKGWSVIIDPPNGEPLTAGRTYEAGSGSGQGSLTVTGQSGYCERRSGRFTVDELVRSYDTVRLLKVSFVYHCNENPAGMRGTLSFRAGDATPPAPWMLAGPGATDLGTAPGALPVPSATPTPAPSATPVAPAPGGGPGLPATVTLVSEGGGDWILGGGTRRFDAVTEDITPTMRGDGWLDLSIYGEYDEFFLGFQAARGPLVPGVYTRARAVGGGRGAGRPGLDIWGNGRACNDLDGSFEVRELVLGPGGKVERAWVLFEQHCEGVVEALHGEVRIGAPAVSGPRTVPTHVRWPDRDHGGRWRDVPVQVRPGAAPIERVEIVGGDASDFTVVSNGCAGAVAACDVRLRFQSGAPGARRAWLRVTDAAGARADVPLQGFAYGGETGLTVNYHNSDSRGVYGPDSRYRIWLSRSRLRLDVDPVGGGSRDLRLEPALGDVLAPGTYTDVAGYPNNAHLPGMSFASDGSDCSVPGAKFTIHRFKLVAGEVKELALDFETACGTFKPYGTFNFRKGDTTPLAPWMVTGPASDTGVAPGATPTPTPDAHADADAHGHADTIADRDPDALADADLVALANGHAALANGDALAGLDAESDPLGGARGDPDGLAFRDARRDRNAGAGLVGRHRALQPPAGLRARDDWAAGAARERFRGARQARRREREAAAHGRHAPRPASHGCCAPRRRAARRRPLQLPRDAASDRARGCRPAATRAPGAAARAHALRALARRPGGAASARKRAPRHLIAAQRAAIRAGTGRADRATARRPQQARRGPSLGRLHSGERCPWLMVAMSRSAPPLWMKPGETVLTRMPRGASSLARPSAPAGRARWR